MEPRLKLSRGQVVLAEDDTMVRIAVAALLTEFGWDVAEASTAADALAAISASTDLLIADLHLPDGNGVDLAVAARRGHPQLPVMIATGEPMADEGDYVWLAKPFRAAALRRAIEAAISVVA
ncbi:MAG: response regulator transcription factor [Acetobacteraceae bacterium]|nr:response regulator transcription factor [Acetobacteraceae bacterium]